MPEPDVYATNVGELRPVSIASVGRPVTTTFSVKVTVIGMVEPTPYDPAALVVETPTFGSTVGGVASLEVRLLSTITSLVPESEFALAVAGSVRFAGLPGRSVINPVRDVVLK